MEPETGRTVRVLKMMMCDSEMEVMVVMAMMIMMRVQSADYWAPDLHQ